MSLSEKEVEHIAELAKIKITEKEKKQFRKWTKTMAFVFTDLGPKTFYTNIELGTPGEVIEGEPEKANIKITTDTATWIGIMKGDISGMK